MRSLNACVSRLEASRSAPGPSRACRNALGDVLKHPGALLGRLEASRSALAAVSKPPGALLQPSRGLPERSWSCLEASRSALGAVLRPPRALLEPSRGPSGSGAAILRPQVAPTSVFSSIFEASRQGATPKTLLKASCRNFRIDIFTRLDPCMPARSLVDNGKRTAARWPRKAF